MLKEPTLTRVESLTNTEMSSQTSDSEREILEGSLRTNQLMKPTSKRAPQDSITHRSSSLFSLSPAEMEMLSKTLHKEQRSILVVRTQKESLNQSIDNRLATSNRPAGVSFGNLYIREFARRPGDNPGCRIGVSLTIDWEVQDEQCIGVEAYEESRPARRDRGELNIPSETRMQMLRDSGYSRGEILTYVKMANIARGQRNRTNETLQLAGAEEFAQKLFRGVLNKTSRRSQKKKEKKLIKESISKDKQLSVLRRQVTSEETKRRQSNVLPTSESSKVPEQAPRRPKRDSLAIVAPVNMPVPSPEEDSSETSSSDYVDEAWTPALAVAVAVQEVEC